MKVDYKKFDPLRASSPRSWRFQVLYEYARRANSLIPDFSLEKFEQAREFIGFMVEMERDLLREEIFKAENILPENRSHTSFSFEESFFFILTRCVDQSMGKHKKRNGIGRYEIEHNFKPYELFSVLALLLICYLETTDKKEIGTDRSLKDIAQVIEAVCYAERLAKVPVSSIEVTTQSHKSRVSRKGAQQRIKSLHLDSEREKIEKWYQKNYRFFKSPHQAAKRAYGTEISKNIPFGTIYNWILKEDKKIKN